MGSDFSEATATDAVVDSFAATPDPRLREVMVSFTRHLHGFVREVEPLRALRHRVGGGQPPEGDVVEHRKPDRAGPPAGFLGPRRCRQHQRRAGDQDA